EAAGNAEITLPAGHIVRANETFIRLSHAEDLALSATRVAELVHPDDRAVVERVLADLATEGHPISQVELRFGRESDAPTWVQFSAAPVEVAKDGRGRAVVVAIDVTSQHELEAKLVQARKVEALGRL